MADGRVVIEVTFDDGRVARGVANIERSLGGIGQSARSGIAFVGKLAGALGLVAAAQKGIELVRSSMEQAFKRIDTMEQFRDVMTAITKSTDVANKTLAKTTDIVTGTGYRLDAAALAVQNFVTRGVEVEKATKYIEAWGDAVAFYGDGSNEQFATVTDALGKMVTAGKVHMDQMNRIFDVGINPIQMYADATGRNVSEVADALSRGKIGAEEFIDVVTEAMMEGTGEVTKIAGYAKKAGASWGAVWGNMRTHVSTGIANIIMSIDKMLKDNGLPEMRDMIRMFGETVRDIFNWIASMIPVVANKFKELYQRVDPVIKGIQKAFEPLNERIRESLQKFSEELGGFATKFQEWGAVIQPIIQRLIKGFKPLVDTIVNSFMELWNSLGPLWENLKELFRSLEPILTPVAALIGGLVVASLISLIAVLNSIIAALGPFINAVVNAAQVIVNVVMAIISLMQGDFSKAWDYLKRAASSTFDMLKNLFKALYNQTETFINTIINIFKALYNALVGNSIIPDMVNGIIRWFEKMKSSITTITNGIKTTITTIWNGIKSVVTTIVNGIKSTITTTWNGIKAITSSVWNGVKTTIGNGISGALNTVKSYTSKFLSAGKGLLEALTKGIKEGIGKAVDAVKGGMKTIRSYLPFSPAKEGPLRDLDKSGESFFPTWGEGVEKGFRSVRRLLDGVMAEAMLNVTVPAVAIPTNMPSNTNQPAMNFREDNRERQPLIVNLELNGKVIAQAIAPDVSREQYKLARKDSRPTGRGIR